METTTHKMSEHWKTILFCAVFFPACLSSLTCYLASIPVLSIDRLFLVAVYMLLQFAMACWVLGASNLPSWWRFGTLVLCLVLINLQALPFVNSPIHPPLFAGQIGFLTSIAILGAGVCNLRILFCSVGILMLWRWKLDSYAQDVAFVEIIASAVICLLLRLVGVRISRIPISIPMKRQFGIRQMLFATSLFAVASAFAPSLVEALSRVGISLWTLFFAISGAGCMALAIFAVLGQANTTVRVAVTTALTLVAGWLFFKDGQQFLVKAPSPWNDDFNRYLLTEFNAWLVVWFSIAPAVMMAFLLYSRLAGYRMTGPWNSDVRTSGV